ncbi:hypothetical protein HELRODRAFT_161318 [Helobdella robusta]|uniref:Major facilitator superfamily (MFS) profile domain-containing protein n=1 Tax=Helobdella robusta TaxID=6412 RepID=T1ERC0_HELRO|nr:hypothetical protein HELRODRAFT_161318 [Helobdella robusta]ESO02087.1 hypothetical protein HELRODRAFT_161318 [Helobdella robusta]
MADVQNDDPPQQLPACTRIIRMFKGLRRNKWSFIILFLTFSFTQEVQGTYTASILTTLEKNFNLPSSLSSIIVTISTLGYISSAISVSFFIKPNHYIRLFAICMLVTGFCSFLYVLPRFIFKEISSYDENNNSNDWHHKAAICNVSYNFNRSEGQCTSDNENKMKVGPNYAALVMFIISEIVYGAAGACLWTVGLTFIDENMSGPLASKLIGLYF